jgi:hypothetical protein
MEDFIFGTLSTDDLKLLYHRASKNGLHHAYWMQSRDPKPDQPVTLFVESGPDVVVDHLACYFTSNLENPRGSRGGAEVGDVVFFEEVDLSWDTFVWGYVKKWKAVLPAQTEGTEVRYTISGWAEDGLEIYADWPDVKLTVEHAAKVYFKHQRVPEIEFIGEPHRGKIFNYFVDTIKPPQWAKEAVIYHIFVDRFHPGCGRDWIQTVHPKKAFGGTLDGITDHMDYLQELGITAIWLSPIFPSPSIHRYDAVDYYHVAEELGGDAALHKLVDQAHQKGIRIILDLVCNHISSQHPYFIDALQNKESTYRNWFYFDECELNGYRTFFGVKAMPQVNLNDPAASDWMLDIARYWLEVFNVDGYRLDHANGPGPGFWGAFWQVCKAAKPDSIIFGEVVEPSDVLLEYVGRMDGLLDFHVCEAIRKGIGSEEWDHGRFERFIDDQLGFFPDDFLMFSFLDNHDMNRFSFSTENDISRLKKAATFQFQLPGPPIIYYGTEVGLLQKESKSSAVGLEASRGKMAWGESQDKELLAFYKALIAQRKINQPWKL